MNYLIQRCLILLIVGIVTILTACVNQKSPETMQSVETPTPSKEAAQNGGDKSSPTPTAQHIVGSMNAVDHFKASQALEKMEVGQSANWSNPVSGNQYTVIPNNTFVQEDSRCRSYTLIALIQTQQYRSEAVACRNRHNDWNLLA